MITGVAKACAALARRAARIPIDRLAMLVHSARRKDSRILVVRLDAIGDFVLWLDAVAGLRRLYPEGEYELVLLANKLWAPLAVDCGLFDRVLPIDFGLFVGSPYYRFKTVTKLRLMGFGKALHPTYSRVYMADYAVKMSGAEERVGFDCDLANISAGDKDISDGWYTRLIPAGPGRMMELKRNAEFVRGLGLKDFIAALPRLPHGPSRLDIKDYFVVVPGAGWTKRQWPLARFVEATDLVHSLTGLRPVVCGGPGEEELGRYIKDNTRPDVVDLTGRTTLGELASIIGGARLFIGNETGVAHIAVAVSTPSVCILGGGHFGRFMPYGVESEPSAPLPAAVWYGMDCFGCNWRCPYRTHDDERPLPCIEGITVDAVLDKVSVILDRKQTTCS